MSVARSGQRDVGGEEAGGGGESETGGGGGGGVPPTDGVAAHAVVPPLCVRQVWQLISSKVRSELK